MTDPSTKEQGEMSTARPVKPLPLRKSLKSNSKMKRAGTNLDTLPFDILIDILKLKICAENKCLGQNRIPDHLLPFAALPLARISHKIRHAVFSYSGFWTRISSKMPKVLQKACLVRSGDSDIHVEGHTTRFYPTDPEYHLLEEILKDTIPHSHRWRTFTVYLCTDGAKHYEDYFKLQKVLHARLDVPRLNRIVIAYKSEDDVFKKEIYRYGDVGDYGAFYHQWNSPNLTELVTIDCIPAPKATITKWTLMFNLYVNEARLVNELVNVNSLDEVHIDIGPSARLENQVKEENWSKYRSDIPHVKNLKMSLYSGRDGTTYCVDYIGSLLRFPEVTSLKLSVFCRPHAELNYLECVLEELFIDSATYPSLETFYLNFNIEGDAKETKARLPLRYLAELKHLKIHGWSLNLQLIEAVDVEICKDLRTLTLFHCVSSIAPFVKDLVKYMEKKGYWDSFERLTFHNCSSSLEAKIKEVVPEALIVVVRD